MNAARDQALFWPFLNHGCVSMTVRRAVILARATHETVGGGGGGGGGGAPTLPFGLFDEHCGIKPASTSLSKLLLELFCI